MDDYRLCDSCRHSGVTLLGTFDCQKSGRKQPLNVMDGDDRLPDEICAEYAPKVVERDEVHRSE